jgi:hypothetical protein
MLYLAFDFVKSLNTMLKNWTNKKFTTISGKVDKKGGRRQKI